MAFRPCVALLVVASTATPARAADPDVTLKLEAGSEVDSNAHRAPSGASTVGAAVGRLGVRFDLAGRAGEAVSYAVSALGAAKAFAGADSSSEDVAVAAADARIDVGSGAVAPGLRLSYYDVFGQADNALTLRTGDAAAALTVRAGDLRVAATAGWRFFTYKSLGNFDFDGPHAGLTVGHRVHGEDSSWQLAWAAAYGAAVRGYGNGALASICAPGAPIVPTCLAGTDAHRSDLFHDLAAQVTYTGGIILGLRLDLQVDDSNSFGQSLVRGRVELSGTAELFFDLVATAKVVLQVDAYPDGLLLGGDVGTFTTIEDEARNALILHLTRDLTDAWTLEGRVAAYANPFASSAIAYSRQTAYLGVVYTFRPASRAP
jgi:hypothetical protein